MAGRYPDVKEQKNNVVDFPGAATDTKIDIDKARDIARENRPKGMSAAERKVWDASIPEVILAGRFKPLYRDFFQQYCVVVARMKDFLKFLDDPENGWKYTTYGRNGTQHKTRPEASQYNDDWRKWNSMINQIGMSPATDQRFHNLQPDLFDDAFL